jgi:hypothetical protein
VFIVAAAFIACEVAKPSVFDGSASSGIEAAAFFFAPHQG